MNAVTEENVLKALSTIEFKKCGLSPDDITANIKIDAPGSGVTLQVVLDIPPHLKKEQLESLQAMAESSLTEIGRDARVFVILSTHKDAPAMKKKQTTSNASAKPKGVKKIIAIASGKGGVGKSLVSVNLALALAYHHGLKVGLMDADIQGPSIPHMMGLRGSMEQSEQGLVEPILKHGVSTMSIGLVMDDGQPAIWRGPMMHKAISHIVHGVEWGELDVLIVDTPPGTGDVQLSLNSQMPMDGVVIVSTPQELALADARRGISLFRKMNIPVLGMVENMSATQNGPNVFGSGGAELEAEKQDIRFLGKVPLNPTYMQTSDAGTPIVAAEPKGPDAKPFKIIADKLYPTS